MERLFIKPVRCWSLIVAIILSIAPVFAKEDISLPDFGDPSGRFLTPIQEKELGEAFYRNLHTRIRISHDPELQDYIESLGNRLAATSDTPKTPFHFFVVLDPVVNAFAGPGGYIGIYSGLMLTTESESELASVMAHEIAHITQRHLYRAFEAANRLTIPIAAATLAAILLGTQSAELGQAALIALQAGSTQYQINFTRDNEQEADRVGLKTLVRADLDPRSMPIFFKRLQQSSRYYGREIPEFLRTHPVTVTRISDTRGRAEKYPYRQYPDSLKYQLTKAKLRVLTAKTPQSAIDYFKSMINQGTSQQKAVTHYGLGLAYSHNGNFSKAKQVLTGLIKTYEDEPRFANALGRNLFDSRNFNKAVNYYKKIITRFPNNKAITFAYIEALLQAGSPKIAQDILMRSFRSKPSPLEAYDLLAQSYEIQGNHAESHRYLAEYYYQIGQTREAITQIKIAQKTVNNNFYLSAILESRLKLFEQEDKERNERKLR